MACAAFFVVLFYRTSVNTTWDNGFQYQYTGAQLKTERKTTDRDHAQKPIPFGQDKFDIPKLETVTEVKNGFALPTLSLPEQDNAALRDPPAPTVPPVGLVPDRKPGKVGDAYIQDVDMQNRPARIQDDATSTTTTIHWMKPPEWFPVPEDSLISLPTGKPKSVPRIQHTFGPEDTDTRAKREDRLAQVKAEMKHAWDGYAIFAFGHDELRPLTVGFADPFAGWGATLVDAMDTLWIMGLKEEFDHAYRGLEDIDFTTTPYLRAIPVFETTIRYLGGLLAAYDVTGGHKGDYPLLLKKAVELAEILMGIFDTPNRMPDLAYKWKPAFAFQPNRASPHSGIAELGSLSMEFTRLAQLTGKDKYYDAVARITDALEEWQNREDDTAPAIPGIFPQNVDASGCNSSATAAIKAASTQAQRQAEIAVLNEPQGYVPRAAGSSGGRNVPTEGRPDVEFQVTPGTAGSPETGDFKKIGKRGVGEGTVSSEDPTNQMDHKTKRSPPIAPSGSSRFQSHDTVKPIGANGLPVDWDCVAQNLTASSGMQTYSMGGSQDSAYEYFPKQYLLLGGLEPKYRTMHEKAVLAVKEWLLYRPMVPNDPDILFSANAKVSADKDLENMSYVYEVTHLTCFLGGMFGLGAKIFDLPEDLEVGKRLADGCVWAYSTMPSGIMPEYAQVVPCRDATDCHWNETIWTDEYLDPSPEWRDKQMATYHERLEAWEQQKQQAIRQEAERLQAAEEMAQREQGLGETSPKIGQTGTEPGVPAGYGGRSDDSSKGSGDADHRPSHSKRDLTNDDAASPLSPSKESEPGEFLLDPSTSNQKAIEEKMRALEAELNLNDKTTGRPSSPASVGAASQLPIDRVPISLPRKPAKPKTHEEFVADRIRDEDLPPGFTQIGDRRYILR